MFPARCRCGTERVVDFRYLRRARKVGVASCGCRQREAVGANSYKHGYSKNRRHRWLWEKYGLTPEQYDALYDKQLGRCSICLVTFGEKSPHVDHDHKTGEVRGLLCHGCNVALGHFREDPEVMMRAIAYLAENGRR